MSDVKPTVSVVIPVFNEFTLLQPALSNLQANLPSHCEVIISDGGSIDGSRAYLQQSAYNFVESPQGRALQMNVAARKAQGDYLLFLHVDTQLPDDFSQQLDVMLAEMPDWGFFFVRLSGHHVLFRMIEYFINLRSSLSAVCTGDQALFISRQLFLEQQGFAEIPLMEDVEFAKRLRKVSKPYIIRSAVITDSRRWKKQGIFKTILLMWRLRLAYFFGANPANLHKRYYE